MSEPDTSAPSNVGRLSSGGRFKVRASSGDTDVRELVERIVQILERIEGYRGDLHRTQALAIYEEVIAPALNRSGG